MSHRRLVHLRQRRGRGGATRRARRGVSLVEILIASLMMTVAVMGLLGASNTIARDMGAGRRQMMAASVAQRRLDSLQSLPCSALSAGGSGTTSGIGEQWSVSGSGATRVLTLDLTVPRVQRAYRYTTIVPCL